MTRELGLAGAVALVFGLGAYYATGHFGAFSRWNLALGAVALVLSLALGAGRLSSLSHPNARRAIARGLAGVALALAGAIAAERLAAASGLRFDWTLERRYRPAPATRRALAELCGPLELLHFAEPGDPRQRRTRLLLDTLAALGDARVVALDPDADAALADAYGVSASNSVVVRPRDGSPRFERAARASEGAITEALYRLCAPRGGVILALRGGGEGDLTRRDALGYSGLAAALETEGYTLRSRVSPALDEVPDDVAGVLAIAPRRPLHPQGRAALERYLARGGSLVALLEPGVESGLEPLLAAWGLEAAAETLRDAGAPGDGIAAFLYETHPITAGLDRNRMTWFPGARGFALRKPEPHDRVDAIVYTSRAEPLAAAGRYPRGARETRIVAIGDADFASNAQLRTLYNLDLALNAVHWALGRESAITLRPKLRDTVQFPLPATDSLRMLYGVGLLIPEVLLVAGGVVWLRRRAGR